MAKSLSLQQRALAFYIPEDFDRFKCKLCKPNKSLNGKKKSNLVTHLQKKHKDEFEASPATLLKYKELRLEKIQAFCEIVTVNGRPFNSLLDTGFQRALRKDSEELNSVGCGINMDKNMNEVKNYVTHVATEIRNKIKNDLKNVFVSLLLDIGTKNRNSFLGICLQYMKNDIVKNITVGMVPLSSSHTASYIVETLMNCLKVYEIDFQHTFAMVSDNAANMIAATRQLDNYIRADQFRVNDVDESVSILPEFSIQNLSEDRQQEILCELREMEELNSILNDEENYEQLFAEVIGELSKHTTSIITIRCAAHSIQLIVRDAIKNSNFKNMLGLCKYITKKLHTQDYKYIALQSEIKYTLPHMACDTRWDAEYDMVSMIQKLNFDSLIIVIVFNKMHLSIYFT